MIKFWSYKKEFQKNKKEILLNIKKTMNSGNIFFGNQLIKLEKNFTKKYNSKYGIAVGSGTDALLISLKAIGVKRGDEVITVANTAIPTISAIINSGAKPRLVDINNDYLMNVKQLKNLINKRTKAIIPVHLYGLPCNMSEIIKISKKFNIDIIEDCAQAQGAKFKNKYVGTFGRFGCFSFYPTKILGSYGDGGFILTNSYNDYKKIKRLRFYGIETEDKKNKFFNKYYSNENGFNSRLDEIQSSILNFKLKKVDQFINRRRFIAKLYIKELSSTNLILPKENMNCKHVYHLFTVYHNNREKIIKNLHKKKIETKTIYPYPIHKMKGYKSIFKGNILLKNSQNKSKGIFSLPLYPELSNEDILYICKNLKNILKNI